ncbi:MAG: hypothetical protein MI919_00860, partial [Holophagales bacterium]|nr:hypothetical protein [Holophagales bacterium]
HAEVQPMYERRDRAPGGDAANSILYWARLRGESSTSTWYSSQAVVLDAYGEGARYKSQSTNSRRYALEVWDKSPPNEGCKEHFHVLYRNRNYINGGGGGGGLIPK